MKTDTVQLYRVDVICAWCGRKIGEKDGFTSNEPTHGMCKPCYRKVFPVFRRMKV